MCSLNNNIVIKLRRMRLAGHTSHMGVRNLYKILFRKPERKRTFGDQTISGVIILKEILSCGV
jgi:hypothetical protein